MEATPQLYYDVTDVVETTPMPMTVEVVGTSKEDDTFLVPIRKYRTECSVTSTPTGWAVLKECPKEQTGWKLMSNVSENYLLLSNHDAREVALSVARESDMSYKESRIFWNGSMFRHEVDLDVGYAAPRDPGDIFSLMLVTENSYNGVSRFSMSLMAKRLICSNGMTTNEMFGRADFKHLASSFTAHTWESFVENALNGLMAGGRNNLERFVNAVDPMKDVVLTQETRRQLLEAMPVALRGPVLWGKIDQKLLTTGDPYDNKTLYDFLNAGTNVLWHNPRPTKADFDNNGAFVDTLLGFVAQN